MICFLFGHKFRFVGKWRVTTDVNEYVCMCTRCGGFHTYQICIEEEANIQKAEALNETGACK